MKQVLRFFSPASSAATLKFTPWNLPRRLAAVALAFLLLLSPIFFSSGTSLNVIAQFCIAAIFALSFNMLLGLTGMLSFGHAVYSGLAAFVCIHVMNKISDGSHHFPISLIPLVGGCAGAFFGGVFGFISTKKSGITFAMISLGIGELVYASSLMMPGFFGGEGGVSANRVSGSPFWGISFGPQIEVTYLIIFWTILAVAAIYFVRVSTLGKLAEAVRDNPERVAFIGFDAQKIRLCMMLIACFFAGIAGGLSAINFEIVSAESVGAIRSGTVLFFTYIGGVGVFLGPVLGALIGVFMSTFLSELTPAWSLYMGLLFMAVVSFAPRGLSGSFLSFVERFVAARAGAKLMPFLVRGGLRCLAFFGLLLGIVIVVELLYRLRLSHDSTELVRLLGFGFSAHNIRHWLFAGFLLMLGGVALKALHPRREQA